MYSLNNVFLFETAEHKTHLLTRRGSEVEKNEKNEKNGLICPFWRKNEKKWRPKIKMKKMKKMKKMTHL